MRSDKIFFELVIIIQSVLGSVFLEVPNSIFCVHSGRLLGGLASVLYSLDRGILCGVLACVFNWRPVRIIFNGLISPFFVQPVSFFSDVLASVFYRRKGVGVFGILAPIIYRWIEGRDCVVTYFSGGGKGRIRCVCSALTRPI